MSREGVVDCGEGPWFFVSWKPGKGFFGCFLNAWSEGTLIFQPLVQWALNFNQYMNFYPNQLLKDMNYNLPI